MGTDRRGGSERRTGGINGRSNYMLSDVPLPSLRSDTTFFTFMGSDHVKVAFFKAFVEFMRKTYPSFGRGCCVDSTPLPNDIADNPFNALCRHGVTSCEVMTRLILVLDEDSGLPVWYDIIPGNVLDINTIMNTINDVADTLDIEIQSLIEHYLFSRGNVILLRSPEGIGPCCKIVIRHKMTDVSIW